MTISVSPRVTGVGTTSLRAPIDAAIAAAIARTIEAATHGGVPAAPGLARPQRGPDPVPLEAPVIATITIRG